MADRSTFVVGRIEKIGTTGFLVPLGPTDDKAIAAMVLAARNWNKLRRVHSESSPKVVEALSLLLVAAQAID
jgi:hypothetical protein